jgi:hypothetical protein
VGVFLVLPVNAGNGLPMATVGALYDYTRPGAFEGIVGSQTLWCSHYREMLDTNEPARPKPSRKCQIADIGVSRYPYRYPAGAIGVAKPLFYEVKSMLCALSQRLWMKQLDEDVHDSSAAILSFGIAFRHQYIEAGALGKKMLEQVPNVFKRERRRDVIEKGTSSQHFVVAVERMMLLLDEMEEALGQQQWLAGDDYTLADVAFTPYLARLEHLSILPIVGDRQRVADWYRRCKARPSSHEAIVKWENPDYLRLMRRRGTEAWPQIQAIIERREQRKPAA